MHEARLIGANMFGQMGEKGDDVMFGDGLDFVNAGDVELHVFGLPHGLGVFARDHAQIGHGITGMGFDLVPDAEFGGGRPDGNHFGTGITGNHVTGFQLCYRGWRGFTPVGRKRQGDDDHTG